MKKVAVPCLCEIDRIPRYETANAAGADLKSAVETVIGPGEWKLVPTGLKLQIPPGVEGQVRPRSGLAVKKGVTILNAPGTIDSDYRGEIQVILINHGKDPFVIKPGDRIAQIVFAEVLRGEFSPAPALSETERGAGGFGSTG